MRLACLTLLVVCAAKAMSTESSPKDPVTLDEVLQSVDRHYPVLLATIQEIAIADAGVLSAEGEFDLKAKAKYDTEQFGYYKNRTVDAYLEQSTQFWGANFYGGYKRGTGNYGPWEQNKLSLDAGEWRGGFSVPLLRDRAIDRRRADLSVARLAREVAEASIGKQRVTVYKEASKRYWEWIAAGQQLEIAQALLELAQTRVQGIRDSVDLGQTAPIELTDNQRAILQRQSAIVTAERALQNAAIELSLFLRDDAGAPLIATADRLPPSFPSPAPVDDHAVSEGIAYALRARPEIDAYLTKRRQESVVLDWARNQTKPSVDLSAEYSRDSGQGSITKVGDEVYGRVEFELPFQRRKARGKVAAQQAKLEQLDQQLRFTRDRIVADVRDAASAVRAAFEALQFVRQEVDLARRLEQAERDRFELGDSTLFVVNLRELSTADAALREVKALAEYFKAMAEYEAATAARLR